MSFVTLHYPPPNFVHMHVSLFFSIDRFLAIKLRLLQVPLWKIYLRKPMSNSFKIRYFSEKFQSPDQQRGWETSFCSFLISCFYIPFQKFHDLAAFMRFFIHFPTDACDACSPIITWAYPGDAMRQRPHFIGQHCNLQNLILKHLGLVYLYLPHIDLKTLRSIWRKFLLKRLTT